MVDFFAQADLAIFQAINGLAGQWPLLDQAAKLFAVLSLAKGGVFLAVLWGLWFMSDETQQARRLCILRVIYGAFVAAASARLLQLCLPARLRPMHDSAVHFIEPYSFDSSIMPGWSSFPSDHAVLFFALAVGVYQCHRHFGVFLGAWAVLVISLPRVYLGLHYPSDIVCGILIGTAIMILTLRLSTFRRLSHRMLSWEKKSPSFFYAAAFLVTWQIATLGEDTRRLLSSFHKLLTYII